jgi:hypothetical protein
LACVYLVENTQHHAIPVDREIENTCAAKEPGFLLKKKHGNGIPNGTIT